MHGISRRDLIVRKTFNSTEIASSTTWGMLKHLVSGKILTFFKGRI